jgi:hypothetical protein
MFEVLIRVGAKDIPQLAIPVTTPRPLIDAVEKASIDKLVEQIHRVERQAKAKKGGIQKFTRAQINPLIRAAEGANPVYAFTVGQAYVRDLVELGDESSEPLGPEQSGQRLNQLLPCCRLRLSVDASDNLSGKGAEKDASADARRLFKAFFNDLAQFHFQDGPGKGALNESPVVKGARPIEPRRNRRPVNGLHVSSAINSPVKSPRGGGRHEPQVADSALPYQHCLTSASWALAHGRSY